MKKNTFKIISLFSAIAIILIVVAACKKSFLDQETIGLLTEKDAQSKKGAQQFLTGSYAALKGIGWDGGGSNWVYGSIVGGEANKGSDAGDQAEANPIQQYVAVPTNGYFNNKWRALYEGVSRCNATIRIATNLTAADISDAEKAQIIAEARFLRGFYHFEAKKMWNKVPYVDETVTYEAQNFRVSNKDDIWTKIMDDLNHARNTLPATQSAVGRINKWGAAAFTAKALLYQKKYAEARTIFTDVINNGVTSGGIKYALAPAFHDVFNAEAENDAAVRAESIFAYEASINDGSGAANANYDGILNWPYDESGNAPGGCCGFFQPSFEFVNSFRTVGGLPLLDGSYNTGANQVKNDQGVAATAAYTPDPGPVDPRLDWTVGRRGVPYLDWGNHPGIAWIRDQGNGGPYAPLKNVHHKSHVGTYTDGTTWTGGVNSLNYKFMRFADVLLMAAECEIEVGSLATALQYVNRVRARASNPTTWVQGSPTSYAISQYVAFPDQAYARNAVRFERKLELGQEGHRFFDLVRWGIADVELNKFLAYEKTKLASAYGAATFTKGKNEYFPIPQRQIDLQKINGVSTLEQNPGY